MKQSIKTDRRKSAAKMVRHKILADTCSKFARKWLSRAVICGTAFCLAGAFLAANGHGAVIDDRAGGSIYWGGKYVNIKASAYKDFIGSRTAVDQVEVIMKDDMMTVKITGPYFFYYVHKVNHTENALPGDLYISSQGWKVSGRPPFTEDIFEASEGWDYVVSLEKKKVYMLEFPKITMSSALPHERKYRAHQAWRGGYGKAVDDAAVTLTDRGLEFIFSVRNMKLASEIGLHWTMKCGNDIIEGSALIPAIAITPEPTADGANADPIDIELVGGTAITAEAPIAAVAPSGQEFGTAGGSWGSGGFSSLATGAGFPMFLSDSHDPARPIVPTEEPKPFPHPEPSTPVPEPSAAFLILAGLIAALIRRPRRSQPNI
jgi:hypothetical protein